MEKRISGTTKLLGIIGSPVSHSISPKLHNTAFRMLGLDMVYLAFDVTEGELAHVFQAVKTFHMVGLNVTMPLKKAVIPYLDTLSREAALIGAVNTIKNENGFLTGYNTDGMGFVQNLKNHHVSWAGKKIILVGAGGAGRSIGIQLALEGAKELVIVANNLASAQELSGTINTNIETCKASALPFNQDEWKDLIKTCDILLNCTSLGMEPDTEKCILEDAAFLAPHVVVCDIVYHPLETGLLRQASLAGCKTVDGIGMLYQQGAAAFKIWTGLDMPVDDIVNSWE